MGARSDETLAQALRDAAATTPNEADELSRVADAMFGEPSVPELGRYQLIRRIGAGGLGVVYLARDPELERPVAIKLLARKGGANATLDSRMQREAQALARLRHPNVVSVYDVGRTASGVFVAMEYVAGRTLRRWLAESTHSMPEIRRVIAAAARGLAAAHRCGIVHRDVKPDNILIEGEVDREVASANVRVVDFGLAYADRADPPGLDDDRERPAIELTATGMLLGTPAYMAPEQFVGEDVDARADQWGLAVTLYEAVSGRRPFEGETLEQLRAVVMQGEAAPLRSDLVPAAVREAVTRALARDPARRFASMDELADAIDVGAPRRSRAWAVAVGLAAVGATALAWTLGHDANTTALARGASEAAESAEPAVVVSELRAVWSTPNTVRWQWHAAGRGDELRDYELVTGPTEADVRERSAAARVIGRDDNPELGHFLLPRTGGEDPVLATTTDLHAPESAVFAQLLAIDTAGRKSGSNVAAVHTPEPPIGEIVVFADAQPRGFAVPPAELQIASTRPFAGTHHLEYVSTCAVLDCFANLRWQGLEIELAEISAGSYATTAYLELAVAVEHGRPSWWSQVRVWYDPSAEDRVAHFEGFALRDGGGYRVLQVPLRAFRRRGEPVAATEMQLGLFEIGLGGFWPRGAIVRIDEIRVRW